MRTGLALSAVTLVVACHSHAAPTGPSNRAAAPDYTVTAADVLGFVPANAELVIGFDLAQLRRSPQWAEIEPTVARELEPVRTRCGFDPTERLTRITAGISLPSPQHVEAVIVVRDVDAEKALACAANLLQKDADIAHDRGALLVHYHATASASAWTAVGPSTLVIQIGATATYDTLQRILASGTPLRGSRGFMGLFTQLERGPSAWFVANGGSHLFDAFDQMNLRPRSLDGTITITDTLTLVARGTYATPDQATQVATLANQAIGSAKQLLERVDVAATGAVVRLDVVATAPQLQMIVGMLGSMI